MEYTTLEMLEVLEYVNTPATFLMDLFVTGTELHSTNKITIDIDRDGKKIAPFVAPIEEGVVITKKRFQSLLHEIPYIKMKRPFKGNEALKRRAGMTQFQTETPAAFISREATKTFVELKNMLTVNEEYQLAQAIQTGIIPIVGKGYDYVIDMQMKASHLIQLTGDATWDKGTTSYIGEDLSDAADLVFADGKRNATVGIMGKNASKLFMKNENYLGSLDRRRVDKGEIKPERLPMGVKYFGFDRESGLDMYGYTESFEDTDGTTKTMIGDNNVVIGAIGGRCEKHYGAIQNVEVNFMGETFPSNWITKDPSVHWFMLESAPAVIPHAIDSFVCLTVV